MPTLPLIRPTTPGIYQALASANTDYVLAVPTGATGLLLWFETSATDPTLVRGRIGFDQSNTVVTGITGTDAVLGYHPPAPVEYTLREPTAGYVSGTWTRTARDAYVHIACGTAGAVARGMWLFGTDGA